MKNCTKTFIINDSQKQFVEKNYSTFENSNHNNYVEKFYKTKDWTLTIYKSQKAVLCGININTIKNELNLDLTKDEIGMDEVGVGDYYGGLVVCAVFLSKDDYKKINSLDIKDSKKLSDKQIINIAQKLINIVNFEVCQIFPNEYNYLYEKFKNTHIIKTILHNNAVTNLIIKNKINKSTTNIILDEYVSQNNYYKYLINANIQNITQINEFKTKAESQHISVACASIIARYYFLKQIETLSRKVGIELPLGAWNDKVKDVSTLILNEYGYDKLNELVKIHFKNTKKLI